MELLAGGVGGEGGVLLPVLPGEPDGGDEGGGVEVEGNQQHQPEQEEYNHSCRSLCLDYLLYIHSKVLFII